MSESLDSLLAKGRPYLEEYLDSHGVETNKRGLFSCIHPDHPDEDPSAGIVPKSNGEQFYCFSCGTKGDIFTAAHLLEGKPLIGPGFLAENVEYVLTKMGVDHDKIELSEHQIKKMKFQRVYQAVVDTMMEKDEGNDFVHLDLTYADERGWTRETCETLGIGNIRDFEPFLKSVQAKVSLSSSDLAEMDITDGLFHPRKCTFTIRDHTGMVCGFVARFIDWKRGHQEAKYKNTSEFKNPFYSKGSLLYGLNTARKLTGLRLDIFEGYGDYVTAYQAGHRSCAAMGGTAFTQSHSDLLYSLGFRHINLVFDDDDTGRTLSEANINKFSGYSGLKVTVMYLPIPEDAGEGQNDPDYFIRTQGIETFRKVRTIGAFEFKMKQVELVPNSEEAVAFAKDMCRLLINEENRIERGRQIKVLAAVTGVDKADLEDEIARVEDAELSEITKRLQRDLKNVRDPDHLVDLLDKTQNQLLDTNATKEDRYLMSVGQSIESWQKIFSSMENMTEGIHGWSTGFDALDQILDGIAKPANGGVCYGIAGAPQHGKSSAMLNIALNVAKRNDDVTVLYWAIDDSCNSIAYKMISMLSGVNIRKVRRMYTPNTEELKAIKEAQTHVIQLIEDGRLIFKDDNFGRSKQKAESWIKAMQDDYGRDILFCVDSLHNILGSGNSDMRGKLIDSSTWLKALCTRIPLTAMATLELVKNRGPIKPNLQAISETAKIEFDFDAVALAWNETQGLYGDLDLVTAKWGEEGNWKPIIELDWQKNKSAAGEKGPVYFKFDPETTLFVEGTRCMEGLELSRPVVSDMGRGSTVVIENEKDSNGQFVPKPKTGPKVNIRV